MKKYFLLILSLPVAFIFMSLGRRSNNNTPPEPNITFSIQASFLNIATTRRCASPEAAYGVSCLGSMAYNAAAKKAPAKSDYDIFSSTIVKNRFYGTIRIVNADNINQVIFERSLSSMSLSNLNGCALEIPVPSNIRCRVIINILEPCYTYSAYQPCYRPGITRSSWGCDVIFTAGTRSVGIDLNETNVLNTGLC